MSNFSIIKFLKKDKLFIKTGNKPQTGGILLNNVKKENSNVSIFSSVRNSVSTAD